LTLFSFPPIALMTYHFLSISPIGIGLYINRTGYKPFPLCYGKLCPSQK
jgi:hypothetical protein